MEETSPYLRQHKDNPVYWRPWSKAALADREAVLAEVGRLVTTPRITR